VVLLRDNPRRLRTLEVTLGPDDRLSFCCKKDHWRSTSQLLHQKLNKTEATWMVTGAAANKSMPTGRKQYSLTTVRGEKEITLMTEGEKLMTPDRKEDTIF